MKVLNIPNIITFVRIIIIPVFVTALIYDKYDYSLFLFVMAAISDSLDGLLARVTKQKTQLGAFLDPLADKFMLVTSFILFSSYNWIPKWLTVIVISRDMIVILGWLLLYFIQHKAKVEPSIAGKAANASQFMLIAYILISINFKTIHPPYSWMFWLVALLTTISGLHYIYKGLKQTNEK